MKERIFLHEKLAKINPETEEIISTELVNIVNPAFKKQLTADHTQIWLLKHWVDLNSFKGRNSRFILQPKHCNHPYCILKISP
jgi:hypothetical protein